MPITIVEGTDATGKTTFCEHYAKQHGAHLVHASQPTHDTWHEEYVQQLEQLVDKHGHVICDRWHIGELIWPKLFNRPSLFNTFQAYEHCSKLINNIDKLEIIIMQRPAFDIIQTLEQRGEHEQIKTVLAAQTLYLDVYRSTRSVPITLTSLNQTVNQ